MVCKKKTKNKCKDSAVAQVKEYFFIIASILQCALLCLKVYFNQDFIWAFPIAMKVVADIIR